MQNYRGNELGMIFQDPMTSLNPVYRIGEQIVESIRAHESVDKRTARSRTVELLRQVGIPNPETRVDNFPHEFSGGMRQRAMIAMALSCNPSILIADEPTTALDVTIQAQIVELINTLEGRLQLRRDLHHPRSRRDRRNRGRDPRHVRRPRRRAWLEAGPLLRPADAVHVGSPRLDPPSRPAAGRAPAHDRRNAAVAHQSARGLQVPPALPARLREVQAGAASSRTASVRPAISTVAGSTSSSSAPIATRRSPPARKRRRDGSRRGRRVGRDPSSRGPPRQEVLPDPVRGPAARGGARARRRRRELRGS